MTKQTELMKWANKASKMVTDDMSSLDIVRNSGLLVGASFDELKKEFFAHQWMQKYPKYLKAHNLIQVLICERQNNPVTA